MLGTGCPFRRSTRSTHPLPPLDYVTCWLHRAAFTFGFGASGEGLVFPLISHLFDPRAPLSLPMASVTVSRSVQVPGLGVSRATATINSFKKPKVVNAQKRIRLYHHWKQFLPRGCCLEKPRCSLALSDWLISPVRPCGHDCRTYSINSLPSWESPTRS